VKCVVKLVLALAVLLSSVLDASHAAGAAPTRPNVLLIMADDQSWGDTGYNGHPELKTPHLDAMAKSGVRFDHFYAAHCNCSPTRASVMTGRHPIRSGVFSPSSPFRTEEVTIAQIARLAGYATGHFGKWHLNGVVGRGQPISASDPLSPGKFGFDHWVSVSNYYDLDPLMARNGTTEQFKGDGSDIATDEALKFIRRSAKDEKRFLAVVWFGSPHNPHRALPADKSAYSDLPKEDQEYYGELTAIDRSVGRLRGALRELKIADNTIVWYCSDNGGAMGPKSTGHLRGSKNTLWDGGVRVPGILEWPARIPAPFAVEVPCSTLDIFPTVLEAIDAKTTPPTRPLDGISLIPLLDRQTAARSKPISFWLRSAKLPSGKVRTRNFSGHAALLEWPYKLHKNPVTGVGKNKGNNSPLPAVLLYDLSKDPRETTDLASQEPERVEKMSAELEAWQVSVEKSLAGADYTSTSN
jgi:arylsulfatase A-like enzyme